MGTGQTMRGEGRRRERFGSGREVGEREVGFKEGRKETATKEVERWKAVRILKCSGPHLPTQGQWDEDSPDTDVSRVGSSALSRGLAQSENCSWASQAGKRAPTSLGQIRSQSGSLASLFTRFEAKQWTGRDRASIPLPYLTPAGSRDAERWGAPGGDGSRRAQLGECTSSGRPAGGTAGCGIAVSSCVRAWGCALRPF